MVFQFILARWSVVFFYFLWVCITFWNKNQFYSLNCQSGPMTSANQSSKVWICMYAYLCALMMSSLLKSKGDVNKEYQKAGLLSYGGQPANGTWYWDSHNHWIIDPVAPGSFIVALGSIIVGISVGPAGTKEVCTKRNKAVQMYELRIQGRHTHMCVCIYVCVHMHVHLCVYAHVHWYVINLNIHNAVPRHI